MTVRTRFAPSPTGSLHIGGARTALYNYLLARQLGGAFVLRIEDTDQQRNSDASLKQLINELDWLGLHWDEGIDLTTGLSHGPHGPYQQSQRSDIYQQSLNQLLDSGQAYYCFADTDAIAAHKEKHKNAPHIHFQSPDRDQPLAQAKHRLDQGESAVIRYRNTHQDETFTFTDLVRGDIQFPGHMIGDFILQRADGSPVYNFFCAIDDCHMAITHVLRGEEHLPNTLRQLMIIDALGLSRPQYGHLSLILGEGNKKLSKRDGAASVSDFQQAGYLPEALLNYLALLGWSDPEHREILTLRELEQAFSTDRLQAAAPHFDPQKLRWVNHQHIQKCDSETLYAACLPYLVDQDLLPTHDVDWLQQTLPLFQADLHVLADICPIFAKLCDHSATITNTAEEVLAWTHTRALLHDWLEHILDSSPVFSEPLTASCDISPCAPLGENSSFRAALLHIQTHYQANHDTALPAALYATIESIFQASSTECQALLPSHLAEETFKSISKNLQQTHEVKGKQLFMPLRVAMIGTNEGMDLKLACRLLTLSSLIKRAIYAYVACQRLP